MTRVSQMAFWLVAVIVLIAVGAMPSGAQAHEGHRHPDGHVAAAATVSVTDPVALPAFGLKMAAAAMRMAGPARMSAAIACDGICCHSGSQCCTGAGLAAESAEATPPRRPGERALARALPARTDVVPEALPEPPRSFA